jgi:DNA-binding transcriptional LysR family regulator
MEIRTLRYFLETAREENMTRAANRLHISQSALSKQLKTLEEELGKKLFIRHSFSLELTEEGKLLKKRANDLIAMADKISDEFKTIDEIIGGNIYFGLAESYQIRYLARAIKRFKEKCPNLHYHITSGDTAQVIEKLDKGLIDFAVLVETPNAIKYGFIEFPHADRWTLIMPSDSPLAQKKTIVFDDLIGLPLFCSEQSIQNDLPRWCGDRLSELNFDGSFRLPYNGSLFTKEGLGYLLALDNLIDTSPTSGLTARPLEPVLENKVYIIWRKQQIFTPIAQKFLQFLKEAFTK